MAVPRARLNTADRGTTEWKSLLLPVYSAPSAISRAWLSMSNRHSHQEGATVKYFAGLDVSLEEAAVCVVDDELARTALYEATNSLLTHSRKWSALRAWHGHRQTSRHGAGARCGRPQARRYPASNPG